MPKAMPDGILLNGKFLSHTELLNFDQSKSINSAFENEVILFYKDWFSDKDTFEVQSSGSTGKPKTLPFSREQMIISARQTLKAFQLKKDERALLCLSPEFIAGKMMMVRALVGGLNLIAAEPSENPLRLVDTSLHFAAFTPQQLSGILKDDTSRKKVKKINTIIVGGGEVDRSLEEELRTFPNKIYHTYGMTETLTHVAIRKLSGRDLDKNYTSLEGVKIGEDKRGCLMIKSPVSPGWVVTNDLVEILDERRFTWKGRYDNVVNSGGIKIYPEEIEDKIEEYFRSLSMTINFFTGGLPDKKWGEKLVLAIEGHLDIDKEILLADLKKKLPRYKSPKDVFLCPQFIYTPTGKIKRKETLELILQDDH